MKIAYILFCLIYFTPIITLDYCPLETQKPPKKININKTFTINPKFKNQTVTPLNIKNRIFIIESQPLGSGVSSSYPSSGYCPQDFIIPSKEFYKSLISDLGSDAYSVLTNKDGLNMSESLYYLTSNKTSTSSFSFIFVYFENGKVKIGEKDATQIGYGRKMGIKCALSPPTVKLVYDKEGDIEFNKTIKITTDGKYFNGYLWKIGDKKFESAIIQNSFVKSGAYKLEFWGNLMTGDIIYLCDNIYVKKKGVLSTQDFSESKIKLIETNFTMQYISSIHFAHSNAPVATRANGGYYIAVSDSSKFLHVLSFDKDDNLVKDFNTTDIAYPQDITETDYGFAYYALDAQRSSYHSYLKLYNKKYELINMVEIMNNNEKDDKLKDSNLKKQIIKYGSDKKPVFGMRFMYRPDNGKLLYSSGIIFLIFCHYNEFLDDGGHTGDTVVTFNDLLRDMNFGITWGASHSLIQSATNYDDYFISAALSDAYPLGIKVEYTSKKEFTRTYDPVNQKYNSRVTGANNTLAGKITGNQRGNADGRLGGILYYEKLGIFCLVYAKIPDPEGENEGKNVIYATTFTFKDNKFNIEQTKAIKIFENSSVAQVRAGKLGDDLLVIKYVEKSLSRGTLPNVYVLQLPKFVYKVSDKQYSQLLMNTNEDLRTFGDGVLIWATSNANGKLVINKIGTPRLNDTYDDINYIITKKDVQKYDKQFSIKKGKNDGLSGGAKFGIALLVIIGIILLAGGLFILWKYIKFKQSGRDFNFTNLKGELLTKY